MYSVFFVKTKQFPSLDYPYPYLTDTLTSYEKHISGDILSFLSTRVSRSDCRHVMKITTPYESNALIYSKLIGLSCSVWTVKVCNK